MKDPNRLSKTVLGFRHFGDKIDITDPCYHRDVWCRMNDVAIIPGDYQCVAWIKNDKEFGSRVGIIGIYLGGAVPQQNNMESIGGIGVDSGLAGFFDHKPDYSDAAWSAYTGKLGNKSAWLDGDGFYSNSGYGDGGYEVFAHKNGDGHITALEIRFL